MANHESPAEVGPQGDTGAPANAGRRRFARGGAAATGIVLTLTSRAGMAGPALCKSASGSLSNGHNSHAPTPTCLGVSPGYWAQNSDWPATVTRATPFKTYFQCGGMPYYSSVTFGDILLGGAKDQYGHVADPQNLGMHIAAAYLNSISGPHNDSFLKLPALQSMWNALHTGNMMYSPSGGVYWSASDVVIYLKKTMG